MRRLALLLLLAGPVQAEYEVDKTCALYLCLGNSHISYTNSTCVDARAEVVKRTLRSVLKPWESISAIEDYGKCLYSGPTPNNGITTPPDAQKIQRSYSKIIMTADTNHPLGVIIVPGECEKEITGPSLDIKEGECSTTLMTYTLFLQGEQYGTLLHINEETGAAYVQDPETGIAEQVDVGTPAPARPAVQAPVLATNDPIIEQSAPRIVVRASADENLAWNSSMQMGGLFFGARHHGWRVNHNHLHRSNHVAIRFISEETGDMIRIGKHNRFAPGYAEGKGGSYVVKIVPSVNGRPDENTVLGMSDPNSRRTQGSDSNSIHWIKLTKPAPLVAGREYWQIWDARTDQGYGRSIFNSSQIGNYYQSVAGITDRGPYPSSNDMMLYDKTKASDSWQSLRPSLIPWVCWKMSSGRIRGNVMLPIYGQNLDDTTRAASRTIQGSKVARQRFTATRDLVLDGMWLFYGHSWKHGIDGSDLKVTFKLKGGPVLATGSYPAIRELSQINIRGEAMKDLEVRTTRTWGYTSFSSDVKIQSGRTYDIELSSGQKGGFAVTASYPWSQGGIDDHTQLWANSNAVIVSEGRWTPDANFNDGAREIDMKLTIVGKPKRMY